MAGRPMCGSRGRPRLTGVNTSTNRIALTVVGAPVTALVVWTVAVPLAGATLAVRMGGGTQTVGPLSVVATSLVAALAGSLLLMVLERRTARPDRVWRVITLAVLVLSLAGPLGSGAGAAAVLTLPLLHLIVGAMLVAMPARRRVRPVTA